MVTAPRALALAIIPLLFAACNAEEHGKTVTLGGTTYADHGTMDARGKNDIDVEADSFYFRPTFINGTPGQTITLKVENESEAQHNISVTGQGIDQDVPAKGTVEVHVTVPESGAIRFFCKYHAGQGMNGELLAGDATPQPASQAAPTSPGTPEHGGYDYP